MESACNILRHLLLKKVESRCQADWINPGRGGAVIAIFPLFGILVLSVIAILILFIGAIALHKATNEGRGRKWLMGFPPGWTLRSSPDKGRADRDRQDPQRPAQANGPEVRAMQGIAGCPVCGAEPPDDSPMGLCPQCLLQCALSRSDQSPEPEQPGGTAAYQGPSSAPAVADLVPLFPQLEILELIGQGGMGAVYKARQTKLDRMVAVKILPAEWGRDPAFAERFAREARALARLSDAHIVAVHDFGESGGLFYVVMEFVDGANLRQLLQTGRLQPEQALKIVSQICDGLQYAHEEGIVHRDIKPENILVDKRGQVKIADFGLAKLMRRSSVEFTLTGSRQIMGTLDYMAPEQRSAPQDVDHRADIYSLGVVLYEMLTGELPLGRFAAPSTKSTVDVRLDDVVFRTLEQEPDRRYQRISEVKLAVEGIAMAAPAPGLRAWLRVHVHPFLNGGIAMAAPAPDLLGHFGEISHRNRDPELTRLLVMGPAAGLFVTGLIFALQALALAAMAIFEDLGNAVFEHLNLPPEIRKLIPFAVLMLIGLTAVLMHGARSLARFENYQLVIVAVILAIVPFSFHAVVGFPVAVVTILVLGRPDVLAGFARKLGGDRRIPSGPETSAARQAEPNPTGGFRGMVRSALGGMLTLFVHRPAAAESSHVTENREGDQVAESPR
jgi:tRNA A-37 threonylcarbamoyl transferase component Bud32